MTDNSVTTVFCRHTHGLHVCDGLIDRLISKKQIAIHYPHVRGPNGERLLAERDNASIKACDYPNKDRGKIQLMEELSQNGGYVCATFRGHDHVLVGMVEEQSPEAVDDYCWTGANPPRKAVVKTLQLKKTRWIAPPHTASLLIASPRQGTFVRWHSIGDRIERLVEGRAPLDKASGLSPEAAEVLCAEYLRTENATGLPRMTQELLPVGRTMKDIDVFGVCNDGSWLMAQVTFSKDKRVINAKTEKLLRAAGDDQKKVHRVMFCPNTPEHGGVVHVDINRMYEELRGAEAFDKWFEVQHQEPAKADAPSPTPCERGQACAQTA